MDIKHTLREAGKKVVGRPMPQKLNASEAGSWMFEDEASYAGAKHAVKIDRKQWRHDFRANVLTHSFQRLKTVIGVEIPEDVQRELDAFDGADPDFQSRADQEVIYKPGIYQSFSDSGMAAIRAMDEQPMKDFLGDIR